MNSTIPLGLPENQIVKLTESLLRVQIASGIFIAILAIATTAGNGLLVVAIWRDPLKCFRTPTSVLMLGLAVADLLTGVVVCPVYSYVFIAFYLSMKTGKPLHLSALETAAKTAHAVSNITMNTSYIILMLFSWIQFTAISCPHKHRIMITKKRVATAVAVTWVYSIGFGMLSFLGLPEEILIRADLYLNTTISLLCLIVAYACLHTAFRRQIRRLRPWNACSNAVGKRREKSATKRERQFTAVNLLLVTFVIVCTLPSTVILYLQFHWKTSTLNSIKLEIAGLIAGDVLLLKMALDPMIYAWRLAQYRRALKALLRCRKRRHHVEELFSLTTTNANAARLRGMESAGSRLSKRLQFHNL